MADAPQLKDITIEDLVPHRGRMKLVEDILDVNGEMAVTGTTVTDRWPLLDGDGVNPLVVIELAAQTSAVSIGWKELQRTGELTAGKGWLVGVKQAEFFVEKIPLNSYITTRAEIRFNLDQYTEIFGTVSADGTLIGEVTLQVMRDVESEE